jgi:hypothetical protein
MCVTNGVQHDDSIWRIAKSAATADSVQGMMGLNYGINLPCMHSAILQMLLVNVFEPFWTVPQGLCFFLSMT